MTHQEILKDFPLAVGLIKAEEGFRATAYKCTAGATTIGYGTNADAHKMDVTGVTWTEAQAEDALLDELEILIAELDRRWPQWRNLNDARRAAVLSSVYQLGIYGAASFKNTIAKLLVGDFPGAADNMLASKWAKQTPQRVQRNADIIRSGNLPQEVNGVQILPAPAAPVVAATQVQPAPQVLPSGGPGMVESGSAGLVPPVRADVPASVGLTIGGIRLSKKLCAVATAFLLLGFAPSLGLHLTAEQQKSLTDLIMTYLVAQGAADLGAPFASILKDYVGKNNA